MGRLLGMDGTGERDEFELTEEEFDRRWAAAAPAEIVDRMGVPAPRVLGFSFEHVVAGRSAGVRVQGKSFSVSR